MKKNILGASEYEVIDSVKTTIKRKIKNKEICEYALTCVTSINAKEYSIKDNEFGMKDDLSCFQISFEPSITNTKIIKILYENVKTNKRGIQIEFKDEDIIEVYDGISWDKNRSERNTKNVYTKNRLVYTELNEQLLDDNGELIISKKMRQKIDKDGNYVMSFVGTDNVSETPIVERYYKGRTEHRKLYSNKRRRVVNAVKLEDMIEKSIDSSKNEYSVFTDSLKKVKKIKK